MLLDSASDAELFKKRDVNSACVRYAVSCEGVNTRVTFPPRSSFNQKKVAIAEILDKSLNLIIRNAWEGHAFHRAVPAHTRGYPVGRYPCNSSVAGIFFSSCDLHQMQDCAFDYLDLSSLGAKETSHLILYVLDGIVLTHR